MALLQLVFFDFDLTLTAFHVFSNLSGRDKSLGILPPYAKTELGQAALIGKLDRAGFHRVGGFALLAFGGPRRLALLKGLLSDLQMAGVECVVCTRGYVGPAQKCLYQLGLLGFFNFIYGELDQFYGIGEYDKQVTAEVAEEEQRFLGDPTNQLPGGKQALIEQYMGTRGFHPDEVMFLDDDLGEIQEVMGTCQTMQVSSFAGLGMQEVALLRQLAGIDHLPGYVSAWPRSPGACWHTLSNVASEPQLLRAPWSARPPNSSSANLHCAVAQQQDGEGDEQELEPPAVSLETARTARSSVTSLEASDHKPISPGIGSVSLKVLVATASEKFLGEPVQCHQKLQTPQQMQPQPARLLVTQQTQQQQPPQQQQLLKPGPQSPVPQRLRPRPRSVSACRSSFRGRLPVATALPIQAEISSGQRQTRWKEDAESSSALFSPPYRIAASRASPLPDPPPAPVPPSPQQQSRLLPVPPPSECRASAASPARRGVVAHQLPASPRLQQRVVPAAAIISRAEGGFPSPPSVVCQAACRTPSPTKLSARAGFGAQSMPLTAMVTVLSPRPGYRTLRHLRSRFS